MSYPKQQYFPANPAPPVSNTPNDDIISAIRFCNIERCKELIASNGEILHAKGWNQQTPLHQACLSGQLAIVKLFIENGANPNAGNSFKETPLHYACRRGVVSLVHMMIQSGADATALDKQGRNCMHFAALGGSVVMLHYLHNHHDLEYDTPDDKGKNILHTSCELRNFDAICYLVKHNRVDPSLKDLRGVTPAHITAELGQGDHMWILLLAGGCELLQIMNQKAETPFDIAKQGSTNGHIKIVRDLEYYYKKKIENPPKGPCITWYFLLLFPFIYLAGIFLLSTHMNSYSGHFTLLSCFMLIYIIGRQGHRLPHICRWSNPIYLGTFQGGVALCAIAQFGYFHRVLWPCPMNIILVTILTAVYFYLVWYLIFLDPGIDKSPKRCSTTGRSMTVLDIAEGRANENEFSPHSEIIHDIHTKYCKICEVPILNMDHHCLFLNTCIAKNNHKHFVIMLIVVMLLQINFVVCTSMYMNMVDISEVGLGDPISSYLFHLYRTEAWLFFLMLLCIGACIWEFFLIYAQLSVISRGSTTYFSMKNMRPSHHALSRKERFLNVVNFFLKQSNNPQANKGVEKENAALLHV